MDAQETVLVSGSAAGLYSQRTCLRAFAVAYLHVCHFTGSDVGVILSICADSLGRLYWLVSSESSLKASNRRLLQSKNASKLFGLSETGIVEEIFVEGLGSANLMTIDSSVRNKIFFADEDTVNSESLSTNHEIKLKRFVLIRVVSSKPTSTVAFKKIWGLLMVLLRWPLDISRNCRNARKVYRLKLCLHELYSIYFMFFSQSLPVLLQVPTWHPNFRGGSLLLFWQHFVAFW